FESIFERSRVTTGDLVCDTSAPEIGSMPAQVRDRFWKSLIILGSQIDRGGAILAAKHSDILATNRATSSYCWPRDGAMACRTLARLGHKDVIERFLDFCGRSRPRNHPFLLQKYRSDGSLGASWHPWVVDGKPEVPLQEDETALTMLLLCESG